MQTVLQFISRGKWIYMPFYGYESAVCDIQWINYLDADCP